jgi:hypothetical protein
MGAIDFKTHFAEVAGSFAPMGRSYGQADRWEAAPLHPSRNPDRLSSHSQAPLGNAVLEAPLPDA